MTTEQAIKLLNRLQNEQFDGIHGDERREALEMAVRALEGDGDTIYRQQAIEALDGFRCGTKAAWKVIEGLPSAQPVNYGSTKSDSSSQLKLNNDLISRQDVLKILSSKNAAWDAYDKVKRLPSEQQYWIPCSERLPRTEDFMIITILDDGGDIPIIYSDFGWYASVGGFLVVDNETRKDVIAWMSLPEPYGGENDV